MELHERFHPFVIDTGFHKISQMYDIRFEHALNATLVER